MDEYFRQPVVVSGAPRVLLQLALGLAPSGIMGMGRGLSCQALCKPAA